MKAQSVQCPGCGADLPPNPGTVTCEYCGKQTVLRPTGEMRRPVVVVQHAGADVQKRTNKMIAVIVGVSLLGMIPAIIIPIVASNAADSAISVATSQQQSANGAANAAAEQARRAIEGALGKAGVALPQNPNAPQVRGRICLLDDVNGDGAAEISAFISSSTSDRSKTPAIIDGANGNILWRGEPLGEGTDIKLLCAGPHWVTAVNDESFELLMVNARDTTKQVRRALSDELDFYGVSDECIAFKTSDRQTLGISVEDGSERSCGIRARRRPHIEDTTTCGIISTSRLRHGADYELDGVTFNVHARQPGTGFLQASAKRGREELWDVPLRLLPVGGDSIGCYAGAAVPGVFVVFGSPRGNDHGMTVLGLNADSGTERWSMDLAGTYGNINEVYSNGRYVVVGVMNRAMAIDPASGQVAWTVGG